MRLHKRYHLALALLTLVGALGLGATPARAHGGGGGGHGGGRHGGGPGISARAHGHSAGTNLYPSSHSTYGFGGWPLANQSNTPTGPPIVADDLPEARLRRFLDHMLGRPPRW